MADPIWRSHWGEGPLVASAIHAGHAVRDELVPYIVLGEESRLREEDPFTDHWTGVAPSWIVGTHSRFQVDLNRPREKAVYREPADAWGLTVWSPTTPEDLFARSLREYDTFYEHLERWYAHLAQRHGCFVVFDLHSYNHRRAGQDEPPADTAGNPGVNVGTGTMNHRDKFARLIDRFQEDLRRFDFPDGPLDVRENVKFQGGHHPRWAHARFPQHACVLAVEFKKFFMDEWTGTPRVESVEAIGRALASTIPGVLEELERLR